MRKASLLPLTLLLSHCGGKDPGDSTTHSETGEDTSAEQPLSQHDASCRSMSFDGLDDFVLLGDSSNLLGLTNALSVSAWVRVPAASTGARAPVVSGEWTSSSTVTAERNSGFALSIADTGVLEFAVATGLTGTDSEGGPLWLSEALLPEGRWVHVAATRDGSSVHLYLDGQRVDSATAAGPEDLNFDGDEYEHNRYTVGRATPNGTDSGLHFTGGIHDVAVWNYALTDAQIGSVMTDHPEAIPTGLVGFWRMDIEGSSISDSSGNANNGSVQGAPIWVNDCP